MSPLLLLLPLSATAADTIYQDTIQGGVSISGSGVATPYDGSATWYSGPDLEVQIPETATIERVFLVLTPKNGGLSGSETSRVRVGSVTLESATLVASNTYYQAYELDPGPYGITGSGSYSYEETGAADSGYQSGTGAGGAALYVVWTDESLRGRRHIDLSVTYDYAYASGTELSLTGLPTSGVSDTAVLSALIGWECANEQDGSITVDDTLVASYVGGRDDSDAVTTTCSGNWNSLVTVGGFGFDDDGSLVGLGGDDPDSEPEDGTSTNSRLSDELYRVTYDGSGETTVLYSSTSPNSWATAYAIVIEMDADEDGTIDAEDTCTDLDADGYGDPDYNPECEEDCDDGDDTTYPGAEELEDGLDNDCDGVTETDDTDSDGITNEDEQDLGTDEDNPDTDSDGLLDGDELGLGTDPLEEDSDGDDVSDGDEVATTGTDPLDPDTDADGLSDGDEVYDTGTDPLDEDSDDDGLTDGEEVGTHDTDPTNADTDADGLTDGDEVYDTSTDPNKADTDGGTVPDGEEVDRGSDPLDASDDVVEDTGAPDDTGDTGGADTGDTSGADTGDSAEPGDTGDTGGATDTSTPVVDDDYKGGGGCSCGASERPARLGWLGALLGMTALLRRRR